MGDILGGLFGNSKDTSVQYLPEQMKDIENTNKFKTDTMLPAWKDYMGDVNRTYDQNLPGMTKAAQGLGNYAGQVGQTFGETGESAARTGISGLSQFFDPNYGKEQFAAAINPIQQQYQTNLAGQNANFGAAGNLGSSRQALAEQQLAGQNEAAQMGAAANVMRDINNQRLQAGSQLGQLGQGYLNSGLQAKGTQLGAAERPMDWQSQRGKMLGMTPSQLYTPQYPGQQSTSTTETKSPMDIIGGIIGKL
jgi:hypothetical protein